MRSGKGYADAWSRLSFMRRRAAGFAVGGIIGFPVLALVMKYVADGSVSSLGFAGYLVAWIVSVLWSSLTVMSWPCPRCRRPFFHTGVTRNPLAKHCMHCALPYGALEDDRVA